MAWQAGNAVDVFFIGQTIRIIISLYDGLYTFPQWHTILLAMMAVVLAFIGNTYGAKWLHLWQNAVFALQILVYLAFTIQSGSTRHGFVKNGMNRVHLFGWMVQCWPRSNDRPADCHLPSDGNRHGKFQT